MLGRGEGRSRARYRWRREHGVTSVEGAAWTDQRGLTSMEWPIWTDQYGMTKDDWPAWAAQNIHLIWDIMRGGLNLRLYIYYIIYIYIYIYITLFKGQIKYSVSPIQWISTDLNHILSLFTLLLFSLAHTVNGTGRVIYKEMGVLLMSGRDSHIIIWSCLLL